MDLTKVNSFNNGLELRQFSDANIQAAITRALNEKASDKKVAVVAHCDGVGASLSAVVKIDNQWSIMAACYKPYSGKLSAEADVVWSPF